MNVGLLPLHHPGCVARQPWELSVSVPGKRATCFGAPWKPLHCCQTVVIAVASSWGRPASQLRKPAAPAGQAADQQTCSEGLLRPGRLHTFSGEIREELHYLRVLGWLWDLVQEVKAREDCELPEPWMNISVHTQITSANGRSVTGLRCLTKLSNQHDHQAMLIQGWQQGIQA